MSGLMKQIAPFNRSPDLDRRKSRDDMDDDDSDDKDDAWKEAQVSRPVSRHASGVQSQEPGQNDADLDDQDDTIENIEEDVGPVNDENDLPDAAELPALIPDAGDEEQNTPSPSLTPVMASYDDPIDEEMEEADEPAEDVDVTVDDVNVDADVDLDADDADEVDEEGDDPDPDDPDEPKYCYCLRGSYGDMVGCDNNNCPREWFHLGCTELKRMPTEEESWYCEFCKPSLLGGSRRRGAARGRGKG